MCFSLILYNAGVVLLYLKKELDQNAFLWDNSKDLEGTTSMR